MGSGVTLMLDSAKLPILPGAVRLAGRGFLTGGCRRNRAYLEDKVVVEPAVRPELAEIAFDPQTSGGLLVALRAAGRARGSSRGCGPPASPPPPSSAEPRRDATPGSI